MELDLELLFEQIGILYELIEDDCDKEEILDYLRNVQRYVKDNMD